MLSLANAFDDGRIIDFDATVRRYLGLQDTDAVSHTALNPRSTGCRFRFAMEPGEAGAGGNAGGGLGENVTANVRTIDGIPKEL